MKLFRALRELWRLFTYHGFDGRWIENGEHVIEAAPGLTYYIKVGTPAARLHFPDYYNDSGGR